MTDVGGGSESKVSTRFSPTTDIFSGKGNTAGAMGSSPSFYSTLRLGHHL